MKKRLLLVLLLGALIVGVYFLFRSVKVVNIYCKNQYGGCSSDITESLMFARGEQIISAKKKIETVLRDNVLISQYVVRYKLPDTLNVYVIEESPQVAIKESDNTFSVFTAEGQLIGVLPEVNVPTLLLEDYNPNVKQREYATELLFALHQIYGVWFGRIHYDGIVCDVQSHQVIFPLEGDVDVQLGTLQLLLFQLNTGGENSKIESAQDESIPMPAQVFDLRYKNPVIR